MAGFAFAGSFFAALLFFMQGDNWQLGAVAVVLSSILGGCSLVAYYAILVDISTEDERDRRLLARLGLGLPRRRAAAAGQPGGRASATTRSASRKGMSVRLSLLSAARVVGRVHDHPAGAAAQLRAAATSWRSAAALFQRSFGQLFATLRELRSTR